MRIPDTVIYKSGYPAQWYFQVEIFKSQLPVNLLYELTIALTLANFCQSKQEEGKFLKKKPTSLQIPKILEAFGAWNGVCDTQVVACFVGTTGKGPTKTVK